MRCKLTLENRTDWNTRDLRRLITETMKQKGYDGRVWQKVIVIYKKRRKYYGYGAYHSNFVRMIVPRPNGQEMQFDSIRFTQILAHELDHNINLRHQDMVYSGEINCNWAKEFTVNPKASPQPKPKRDLVMERYEHSKKMFFMHQKRLNREKNIVKKWQKKVRYYEKKIAERQEEDELCGKE